MTEQCATYTGDIQLQYNNGDWDLLFVNGQPCMTDGFDTAVLLSIFGEPDTWQNGLTVKPEEKYISEFPRLIDRANVTDKTLKDGIQAIKKALQWMIDFDAAESIDVSGGVLSVYGLYWTVEIDKGGITSRFTINWEKGVFQIHAVQGV
jgi:phage gp46-like protein